MFLSGCQQCAEDKVRDDSFLAYYNLITFDELLNMEISLSKGDEVIIYTSDIETEDVAKKVVEQNILKGVKYNILFYNGDNDKKKELENLGYYKVIKLEKNKSSFDSRLSDSKTGFDLMFFKQNNVVKAYFCVNFSVGQKSCSDEINDGCKKPCNKNNEFLFYKKIKNELADVLFENLSTIIEQHKEKQ